jgi:hypothetical protein
MTPRSEAPASALQQDNSANNCPFYGRAYFEGVRGTPHHPPFILFPTRRNQCALITDRHSPCVLEMDRNPVDWRACPIVRHARVDGFDA